MKNISIIIPKFGLESSYEEIEYKLAHLLIDNVVFCNNGNWYQEEGKNWIKDAISFHVNCSDIFGWGCADAEDICYSEISDLYEMYKKDSKLGPAAWCIKKRKMMPQKPVEEMFIQDGIWDLKELIK